MIQRLAFFLPVLLSSVASAQGLVSEEAVDRDAATQVAAFARALSEEGDHYRAIGEYKRALFLSPGDARGFQWRYAIGEAYRAGEQYDAAAKQFEALASGAPATVQARALLGAARSHLAAGQWESAIARSREAADAWEESEPERSREARYVEGWALLRAGRDAEAAKAFERARGVDVVGQGATDLLRVLPQLDRLPSRSPALAGTLGLVPGLGHLYIGEPMIAVSAAVWNGIFIWALVDAIQKENWSLAVVLGLFEAMWYGGSVVGAVSGAHRFNRDARINAIEDLESIASPTLGDDLRQRAQ